MTNIVLFVRDFQKGTKLSEKLNSINLNVSFGEYLKFRRHLHLPFYLIFG